MANFLGEIHQILLHLSLVFSESRPTKDIVRCFCSICLALMPLLEVFGLGIFWWFPTFISCGFVVFFRIELCISAVHDSLGYSGGFGVNSSGCLAFALVIGPIGLWHWLRVGMKVSRCIWLWFGDLACDTMMLMLLFNFLQRLIIGPSTQPCLMSFRNTFLLKWLWLHCIESHVLSWEIMIMLFT